MRFMLSLLLGLAATLASAAPDVARLGECRAMLKTAQKVGILNNIVVDQGPPFVLVGPAFFQLEFKARQGFAKAINCLFVDGAENLCVPFDLRHWKTGSAVARFDNCRYAPL